LESDWQTFLGNDWPIAGGEIRDVILPHNWESYEGYRCLSHGNLHGEALYRRALKAGGGPVEAERVWIFFEGVGSYATVRLNGREVGRHAGGRTCFRVELTEAWQTDADNLLEVQASHPEKIDDLPYVCGGCWGAPNTEGSQPFGIFRPVHLVKTGRSCLVPFGLHIWTTEITEEQSTLAGTVEIDALEGGKILRMECRIRETGSGDPVSEWTQELKIVASGLHKEELRVPMIKDPRLWHPDHPHCYSLEVRLLDETGAMQDQDQTVFGIRETQWPHLANPDLNLNVRGLPKNDDGVDWIKAGPEKEFGTLVTGLREGGCADPLHAKWQTGPKRGPDHQG
jgi:beta-galactosidase/beta-glucuronidase